MAWSEVSISVSREAAEATECALEELGALAITLEDDEDNPVLEPGPGATPLWPTVHVRGLFDADVRRPLIVDGLQAVPGASRPGNLRWREVGEQDWERAWMDRFQPMRFGRRLWIVPTGMEIPHDPENIEICLDPGLAFGTGTHPTTALCLQWLDGEDVGSAHVVDYGCGSGILGIAAALKGAARIEAVDNDPQALEATRNNAARNGVSARVRTSLPEEFSVEGADIVLANILAGPLVELSPALLNILRPGGKLVLSGILEEQAEQLVEAYRQGMNDIKVTIQDGWVRLDGEKAA